MNKDEIEEARFSSCAEEETPSVFLQWKGTDACFDFYCKCGAHCHYDGYFARYVQCPHCDTIWENPSDLKPKKASPETDPYWLQNPKILSHDEDLEDDEGKPVKIIETTDGSSILKWLRKHARWYEFWLPQSGLLGGVIIGAVITLCIQFVI